MACNLLVGLDKGSREMTRQTKPMSTPLARARGLGSAKSGLHHWWHQRVSAVAMVGLVSWMVVLLFSLVKADYQTALNMLSLIHI